MRTQGIHFGLLPQEFRNGRGRKPLEGEDSPTVPALAAKIRPLVAMVQALHSLDNQPFRSLNVGERTALPGLGTVLSRMNQMDAFRRQAAGLDAPARQVLLAELDRLPFEVPGDIAALAAGNT